MEKFKASSVEAGVRLLAEGLQDELQGPVDAFQAQVEAASAAQARLLAQISLTLEGAALLCGPLVCLVSGWRVCVCITALRKVEADDASMPSLQAYADKLEHSKKRLGWLSSIVGAMLSRVDTLAKRVQKGPPAAIAAIQDAPVEPPA